MKMKEKNTNWLSRNSNWLFILLLLLAIIVLNFAIDSAKYLFVYFRIQTLIIFIILCICLILLVGFLGLIIYLEDKLSGRNKRNIAIYDKLIDNIIIKDKKRRN